MERTEHRSFDKADKIREFPNGRPEILKVGDAPIGRLSFEPGWRRYDPVVVVNSFGATNYAKEA